MTLYLEGRLARALGLTRDEIRYMRGEHLKKNRDWHLEGREVVWTESAAKQVIGTLQKSSNRIFEVDLRSCELAPEKTTPAPAAAIPTQPTQPAPQILPVQDPNGPVEMIVKTVYPNPGLLLCTIPGRGDVRVQVKVNRNFRPRMKLRARPVTPTLYRLEGRCPRFPGRY